MTTNMREIQKVIGVAVNELDTAIGIETHELYHRGRTIATMGLAGGILRLLASYLTPPGPEPDHDRAPQPNTELAALAVSNGHGHAEGKTPDWFALGEAVRERRHQLALAQCDVSRRGGPSTQTLMRIENAHRTRYENRTLARLEHGLGWDPGTARAILEGHLPA